MNISPKTCQRLSQIMRRHSTRTVGEHFEDLFIGVIAQAICDSLRSDCDAEAEAEDARAFLGDWRLDVYARAAGLDPGWVRGIAEAVETYARGGTVVSLADGSIAHVRIVGVELT